MAYFNINTIEYIEIILNFHYENVYVFIELKAN